MGRQLPGWGRRPPADWGRGRQQVRAGVDLKQPLRGHSQISAQEIVLRQACIEDSVEQPHLAQTVRSPGQAQAGPAMGEDRLGRVQSLLLAILVSLTTLQ